MLPQSGRDHYWFYYHRGAVDYKRCLRTSCVICNVSSVCSVLC